MNCYLNKPLSEDDISRILDGIADKSLITHVEQCAACHNRVEAARQTETFLGRYLNRFDCPNPMQLGDYHTGRLDAQTHASIAGHIESCSFCQQELDTLTAFLSLDEDAPPAAELTNIIHLAPNYFQMHAEMNAPLRQARGSSKKQLRAQADDLTILIDIQQTPEGLALECMLMLTDEQQLGNWIGSLVEVRTAEELVTASYIEGDGAFRCNPVPSAVLDMRITTPGGDSIVVSDIDVRD